MINNPIICKFFKDFTNHKKKTNRSVVFSGRPFPKILKYRDHGWDLPTIWYTRLLQTHIEEFFRNTTGILVLEGKTGKEIPESSRLGFLEKFLANNFALPDAEDNTSASLNRGGIADLFLLRTLLAKNMRAKFLRSDWLFCFMNICKSGSFKNPFATITSLPDLYCRLKFILLVQTKKVISMNYGSRTSSWKSWRWVRLDLISTMKDIYIQTLNNHQLLDIDQQWCSFAR